MVVFPIYSYLVYLLFLYNLKLLRERVLVTELKEGAEVVQAEKPICALMESVGLGQNVVFGRPCVKDKYALIFLLCGTVQIKESLCPPLCRGAATHSIFASLNLAQVV